MDTELEIVPGELPQTTVLGDVDGTLAVDHSDMPNTCALCQRVPLCDNEAGDLEATNVCGDCKILFIEELGTPIQDCHRRRIPRVRTTSYNSSESIENLFSQEFSNIINLARQRQPSVSEHENQSVVDVDAAARLAQRTSSRPTPSGSGRWRRVLSDTETEGIDSLYGESESNVSFDGYRYFHGESDTLSFSAYGGESDASVYDHSGFMESEFSGHPGAESDLDIDTDIDPMHAGVNQWNSSDEEDEDEDTEWEEEADAGRDIRLTVEEFPRLLSSNETIVPEFRLRIGERRRQIYIPNIFSDVEESELLQTYGGNPLYGRRGFEELIEHLANSTDYSSRRGGAPPAAVSFVNNLPCLAINEEQEKQWDGLACAICKDSLSVGTVVNQLPCFHLYHPSCILPWLSARSSCPLCRYELPTDDKDHEDRNQSSIINGLVVINEIQQYRDGSSMGISEAGEFSQSTPEQGEPVNQEDHAPPIGQNTTRQRWFFLAAASPIVGFVGMVLVLWLGNPLTTETREPIYCDFRGQRPYPNQSLLSDRPNQRVNRSRRWWRV